MDKSREKNWKQSGGTQNRLEKIYLWAIRIGTWLILLTPFIVAKSFFFPFVGPKGLYFYALTEIIVIFYFLLILSFPKYRPKFSILAAAIGVTIFILTISSIFGINFSKSFWSNSERMAGLLTWFHLFAFFVVLGSTFKTWPDWEYIFRVSVGIAAIIGIISLFPVIEKALIGASSQGGATLGNSSFLGTYLLFNGFIALFLFLTIKSKVRFFYGGIFALIAVSLLFSTARAALLSFFGGLFLIGLFYLIFAYSNYTLKIAAASILAIAFIAFFVSMYLIVQPGTFFHKLAIQKAQFGPRFVVWGMGMNGWKHRPWLGYGLENFDTVFSEYFDPALFSAGGGLWFDRAHNVIVDKLVTSGILGLLGYLSILGAAFFLVWKKYFNTKERQDFWLAAVFGSLTIAYFIQNITVFDMPASYMMLFTVLSFVHSGSLKQKKETPVLRYSSFGFGKFLIATFFIIFMAVCFLHFVIKPSQSSQYLIACLSGRNPQARQRLNFSQRLDYCKKSVNISPLGKYQMRHMVGEFMLENVGNKNIPRDQLQRGFKIASQELEKSIKQHPLHFRSALMLAKVYSRYALLDSSKFSRAEETIKNAVALSPRNPMGYYAFAQLRLFQGQPKEAVTLLQKAVNLNSKVARSHWVLAIAAMLANDYELAKKEMENADQLHYVFWRDSRSLQQYSRVFAHFGQTDKIISAFERAVSAAPNNPNFQMGLGEAYLKTGKRQKAEDHFKIAEKLDASLSSEVEKLLGK